MSYPAIFSVPGVKDFAQAVDAERRRQIDKWGDQRHPDGTGRLADGTGRLDDRDWADHYREVCQANGPDQDNWRDILMEEVAEAFAETDPEKLKTELIQCAAVIQAWISDVQRRPTLTKRPSPAVPGIQDFTVTNSANRVWLACCYATDADQCSWQTRFPLYDSPAVDLTTAVGAAQEHRAEHADSGFVLDQSFPEDMIPENVRGFALASFGDNVRLICTQDGCLWSFLHMMGDALDDVVHQAQGHREMCGSE